MDSSSWLGTSLSTGATSPYLSNSNHYLSVELEVNSITNLWTKIRVIYLKSCHVTDVICLLWKFRLMKVRIQKILFEKWTDIIVYTNCGLSQAPCGYIFWFLFPTGFPTKIVWSFIVSSCFLNTSFFKATPCHITFFILHFVFISVSFIIRRIVHYTLIDPFSLL
jgi:hypothetical protein